jgi:PhzF family phenazine biosynthesis protein
VSEGGNWAPQVAQKKRVTVGDDVAMSEVLRYAAFTDRPEGGNPAGVVLDAGGMSDAEMLAIAVELGYSESAFLDGARLRFFSPLAEVAFCGHATVATAVALADRDGPGERVFETTHGPVRVATRRNDGRMAATLTSVPPRIVELADADLDEILAALRWERTDLDPALPTRVGFAGVWHPIIAVTTRERLRDLDYDFDRLGALMAARDWTTLQLVWREDTTRFHARDPFPPGGALEDPATGAAAAALGAYLRELGLVTPPATVAIVQGEDFGRRSELTVDIPADRPEIDVTGTAVVI